MADKPQKTVPLKSPIAGVIEQVPVDKAEKRAREGWTVPTPEELRMEELEEEYGGFVPGSLAAAAAVGRGATFGLSDVALAELGLGEELAGLKEVHPGVSVAGEVGGALLGAGKFAAPGMLARGARIAGAPGRLLWRGGAALERGVGGGVRGAALRGAAEGAVYGAGHAVSEDALGERELTAESLATSMGYGALLGGGLGGALSATGKAVGWGGRRLQAAVADETAVNGLLKSTFGYAGRGVAKAWATSAKIAGRKGTDALEEAALSSVKRRSMIHGQEEIDALIPAFTEKVAGIDRRNNLARKLFSGKEKLGEMQAVVKKGNVDAQIEAAQRVVDAYEGFALKAKGNQATYDVTGITGNKGMLKKEISAAKNALAEVRRTKDAAKLYEAIDSLKREGGVRADLFRGKKRLTPSQATTFDELKSLYETQSRPMLERLDLWGDAALLQQAVNGKWTPAIQADKASKYGRLWLENTTPPGSFERDVWLPTQRRVSSRFKQVTNPDGSEAIQSMRTHLEGTVSFTGSIGKNLKNPTAKQRKFLAETGAEAKAALEMLDEVAEKATSVNQMKALEEGSDAAGLIGGVVGFGLAGGSPAAVAAGMLAGPVLNPGRTIRQLGALDQIIGKTRSKIGGAGGKLRAAAKKTRPVVVRSALQLREHKRAKKAAHAVTEAKNMDVEAAVRARLVDLGGVAPETVEATAATVGRGLAYLAAHAPQPRMREGALGAIELPPSDEELVRFGRRLRAVEHPETLIEDLHGGRVSHEAVDAVMNTAPAYYRAIHRQITDDLRALSAKGRMVPYDEARSAAIVLGQPVSALDTLEVAQLVQATYHEPEPVPPPQRRQRRPAGEAPDLGDKLEGDADLKDL